MGKIIQRCAGIDIGKRFLLCCVLTGAADEEPSSKTLRFDTTVPALERLRQWLGDEQVTHVAMESTGSYWIPVFNVLEDYFTVVLANPEEVKNRKGHKTDRRDAKHLADLLRHEHIRPSYIPPKAIRQLRDLSRRRVQLTQDATRERNRVQKLLEQANVKIAGVLSDVFGISGQHMILALLDGKATTEQIAKLARGTGPTQDPSIDRSPGGESNERARAPCDSQLSAAFGLCGGRDRSVGCRDPWAHANTAISKRLHIAPDLARNRATIRGCHSGRDWHGPDPVSYTRAASQLGWAMPG